MGADENVEIVRRWFEALREGDHLSELVAPDARMVNIAEFPITGPYIGPEGFRQWYEDLNEVIEDMTIELIEATAIDDERVLTIQRMTGAFKATGIPVDETWAGVGRFEDSRFAEVTGYTSRRKALEAADA